MYAEMYVSQDDFRVLSVSLHTLLYRMNGPRPFPVKKKNQEKETEKRKTCFNVLNQGFHFIGGPFFSS
jgi:hypothetical protein